MKSFFGINPEATTVWRSSLFTVRMLSLVMASIAFSGVLWITAPAGPGLENASAAYLGAAESVVAGHGFRVPTASWSASDSTSRLTRYPPGFSTAIALPESLGFPGPQSARLVEALAAFVAMASLVALVGDAVGAGAAAMMGFALMLMPVMVDVHSSVLSEPLFLALLALTLATMVAARESPLAAGVCAAAALLVRYAGGGLVIGVVLWALLGRDSRQRRLRQAALAAVPAVVVAATWLWLVHGGGASIRRWGLYGGLPDALADAGATIAGWLVPTAHRVSWAWLPAIPLALLVGVVATLGARRARRLWRLLPKDLPLQSSTNVPQMVAARVLGAGTLLGVSYGAVLIAARLFAEGTFTFDGRTLAPLLLLATVLFTVTAATWWRSATREMRGLLVAALVVWGAASLAASHAHVHESLDRGFDLANDAWRGSELIDWVRTHGAGHPLYSNWPAVPYLYLDRPVRGVPGSADATALRAFGDTVAAHGGLVLAYRTPAPWAAPDSALVARSGLRVLVRFRDGQVLGAAAPLPPAR